LAKQHDLLPRSRDGQWTLDDWRTLQHRFTNRVSEAELRSFDDAVRLYPTKAAVATYNVEKLVALGNPIAAVHAEHTGGAAAKSASADDAGSLEAGLHISRGSLVQLVSNLWQEVGLVNGARGTLVDIVYKPGAAPPALPEFVLVRFDDCTGPWFRPGDESYRNVVALSPTSAEWKLGGVQTGLRMLGRRQLPLRLCWAR
jgi:hypothetical protein